MHEKTTSVIIGAAFEVHSQLGYGFLERVYQRALQVELVRRGATAEIERRIQVQYKDIVAGDYDTDLIVDNCVAVEIKMLRSMTNVTKLNYSTNSKPPELRSECS